MHEQSRFINRELSWLEFNQRVLEEAGDPSVPLLEQVFFLAIASSNLDEFFMVRVGGLKLIEEAGIHDPDPAGMRPSAQLSAIHARTVRMNADLAAVYRDQLEPAMARAGLRAVHPDALGPASRQALDTHFRNQIFPAITPTAVRPENPFPLLSNLSLYLLVMLAPLPRKRSPRFAFLPVPDTLPRFVPVPSPAVPGDFLLIEDVMAAFAEAWFPGQSILECAAIRATRNADIHVDETYSLDLAHAMRKVLRQRKTSGCVRMEVSGHASEAMINWLRRSLSLDPADIFRTDAPLRLSDWRHFHGQDGLDHLRNPPWIPQQHARIDPSRKMLDTIAAGDILLSLPFERFDPVIRMIEEAAEDPDVLAIKIVLYRTNSGSPIIEALHRAARAGKAVTALIELKARFDEANNIEWAERLERNGVQVIYGIKDLKTHAKICMVVRREPEGLVRYLHVGTGNYNASTARLYTDVGLLTRRDDLGVDASGFFNAVCGYSEPQPRLKLVQSPVDLKERLIALINTETANAEKGIKARVMAKLNALVDPDIIEALYRASRAGVTVDLIVRGICCLRPGVEGLSERIRVVSIVDRFLEHSRIFFFQHNGARQVYISSADWMPRNLGRRIELMIPVEDRRCSLKLMDILKACLKDTVKGRQMQPDGTYTRRENPDPGTRSQAVLYTHAVREVTDARRRKRTQFEPHLPAGADAHAGSRSPLRP